MLSKSETGHDLTVSQMFNLVDYCLQLGADYQPNNNFIVVSNLLIKVDAAKAIIKEAHEAEANLKNVKSLRKVAFTNLKSFVTQVVNMAMISNIPEPIKENIKSINYAIQGTRLGSSSKTQQKNSTTDKKEDNQKQITDEQNQNENNENQTTNDTKQKVEAQNQPNNTTSKKEETSISVSHQSFVQVAKNFTRLVTLLKTQPNYNPNEDSFKIAALEAKADYLVLVSENAGIAENRRTIAIQKRDDLLYNENTGLHQASQLIKKYIKAIFGANSLQYKKVATFKIINLKKRS